MSKKSIKQLLKEQEDGVIEFINCNPTDATLWPDPFVMFVENFCCGKVKYDNKREVMMVIKDIIEESAGGAIHLRPYRCKKCKKWHLTKC